MARYIRLAGEAQSISVFDVDAVLSEEVRKVIVLTEAQFSAITTPDPSTLYLISDSDSSTPAFGQGLSVRYSRTDTVSIPNDTHTLLTWQQRDFVYGTWDAASTSTVTIPEDGIYRVFLSGQFITGASVSGYMQMTLTVNNAAVTVDAPFANGQSFGGFSGAEALATGWSAPLVLDKNDVLRVFAYQITTASRTFNARGDVPIFAIERVRSL